MYKGKFGLWISVLIFSFVLQMGITFVPKLFEDKDVTLYFNSNVDSMGSEILNNQNIGNFKLFINKNNADIVIADNLENKENYTSYSNYFCSPMVLYVQNDVVNNEEGFILANPKSEVSPIKVDLKNILLAMENGETWKSLGVNSKVVKGNVRITIPNERSPYYDAVVDLFYLTLNDFKVPTETEKEELENQVNSMLEKCDKVVDIGQEIKTEHEKPSTDSKVFIGPEFLYIRGGSEMSRSNCDAFVPVYFPKTTVYTLNMYVKNNLQENESKITSEFLEYISEQHNFVKLLGWRVNDATFSMDKINYNLIDFIPGYNT